VSPAAVANISGKPVAGNSLTSVDQPRLLPYILLAILMLGTGLGISLGLSEAPIYLGSHRFVSPGPTPTTLTQPPSTATTFPPVPVVTTGVPITLRADGLDDAVFGQSVTVTIGELESVLGPPTGFNNTPGNCTIDAMAWWSTIDAYFFQGRFVGYSTGSLLGGEYGESGANSIPGSAMTVNGLDIGDTLAQAQQLYQGAIQTSYSQGGSWSVVTPTGTLVGNLTLVLTPQTRIADINAGSVGCPAATP